MSTMDSGLMVCRLLLAVPFAVAGIQRLTQLARTHRAASSTGAVAAGELAIAAGLLSSATAWLTAMLALGWLLALASPAAVRMPRPGGGAGARTVVRATVLAVPAVVVLWEGYADAGPGIFTWLAGHSATRQITVILAVAALAAAAA